MVLCRLLPLQVLLLLLCSLEGWSNVQFRNWTVPGVPDWSMSTAVNITGWRGRSAVLPCTFTYPGPVYQGRILVIWYKYDNNFETIFECSFPNSTTGEQSLVQCLDGNDQYRLVGDPHQNNISLEFRSLTLNHTGNYRCLVELTEREGAKWTTGYDTGLLVIGWSNVKFRNWTVPGVPDWSMSTAVNITGWRGRSAVLPCTFTYPGPVYQGRILVIWYKYDNIRETIFECSFPNSTTGEQSLVQCLDGNDQYRLVGDPRQNNISLEFRSLTLNHTGNYYCRVELTEREGAKWPTGYDTGLLVIGNTNLFLPLEDPEPPDEADPEGSEERASFSIMNAVQLAQIGSLLLSLTVVSILCRSRPPSSTAS